MLRKPPNTLDIQQIFKIRQTRPNDNTPKFANDCLFPNCFKICHKPLTFLILSSSLTSWFFFSLTPFQENFVTPSAASALLKPRPLFCYGSKSSNHSICRDEKLLQMSGKRQFWSNLITISSFRSWKRIASWQYRLRHSIGAMSGKVTARPSHSESASSQWNFQIFVCSHTIMYGTLCSAWIVSFPCDRKERN